jgi:hypothetical protein
MDRPLIHTWLLVHQVSDWRSVRTKAAKYRTTTEGAHEWIEMNQSLPAVSIVAGGSAE